MIVPLHHQTQSIMKTLIHYTGIALCSLAIVSLAFMIVTPLVNGL